MRQSITALVTVLLVSSQLACGAVGSPENTAPVIDPISPQEARTGTALAFTLTATDAEGDSFSWTVANLPPNATFNAGTGEFSWTPTIASLARFEPSFTVTDNNFQAASATLSVPIEVRGPYVRVRVGALAGNEPMTIDSTTHASLFELAPGIASARLEAVNPAAMLKNAQGAGTWRPAMTPVPPTTSAGYMQLTITPNAGANVEINDATYTTSAQFASNPTSFGFFTGEDGFTTPLSTINLDGERTETVVLTRTPGDTSLQLRWVAGNAFGEFGGGHAGFSTNDLTVNR